MPGKRCASAKQQGHGKARWGEKERPAKDLAGLSNYQ
jgi:hypothetical protein